MLERLAFRYLACLVTVAYLDDRGVLFVLNGQVREILHDIGLDGQLVRVVLHTFAVNHHVCLHFHRSVQLRLLAVQRKDELTCLVRLNGRQRHLIDNVGVLFLDLQLYVVLLFGEVRVLELAGLVLTFNDDAEVNRFGLHVEVAYGDGVFVGGFSLFGQHLAADIHFLLRHGRIGGHGDRLVELTRTAVRVIRYGDATGLTRLYRLFRPCRSRATATRLHAAQYQRRHSFVLEIKHNRYTSVAFVDLTEVMVGLLKCQYRFLTHHGYCDQSHAESTKNLSHIVLLL